MNRSCDVAIIGTGTAGLSALREVRKRTDDFIVINDGPYGTTCARVGCMPSKALVESANTFHRRKYFGELGIHGADQLAVDIPAVLRRVRRLRDEFVAGIVKLTDEIGSRSIAGKARFVAPDVLQVGDLRLQAKTIIIATGSHPIVPPDWAALGARVLTSDTLFEEQTTLPASIAVIGLGSLGIEISQVLARLGIQVTAFGAGQSITGASDIRINERALALLREEFTLHLGHRALVSAEGDQVRVVAGDRQVTVDAVFAALGRRPNLDGLGLQHLGVKLDQQGMPPFNRQSMQVGDLPVYIAGDVNDDLALMHEANDEGHISGYNARLNDGEAPNCFQRRTPLAIVFSDPNIAMVGRRFADLDEKQIVIGTVDFSNQGRARIAAENRGMLRLYANREDGRLLGAEMCAPRGEHLAHLLALAIGNRQTVRELLGMPFYHPVFEEGLRTALRDASRQLEGPSGSDLAGCDPVGATALD